MCIATLFAARVFAASGLDRMVRGFITANGLLLTRGYFQHVKATAQSTVGATS